MNTLRLSGDRWHGQTCEEWDVNSPDWPDVESRIRLLDQVQFTLLSLDAGGDRHLMIGGGAGNYIVYETADNLTFFNLLLDRARDGEVRVNAGGQEGLYPAIQVVDLETALQAAHVYWSSLERDPTLLWVEQ